MDSLVRSVKGLATHDMPVYAGARWVVADSYLTSRSCTCGRRSNMGAKNALQQLGSTPARCRKVVTGNVSSEHQLHSCHHDAFDGQMRGILSTRGESRVIVV